MLKQRAPHPARLTGRREAESNEAHALANAPKHTVLSMTGLTSAVWTIVMFQMVSGESASHETNQTQDGL